MSKVLLRALTSYWWPEDDVLKIHSDGEKECVVLTKSGGQSCSVWQENTFPTLACLQETEDDFESSLDCNRNSMPSRMQRWILKKRSSTREKSIAEIGRFNGDGNFRKDWSDSHSKSKCAVDLCGGRDNGDDNQLDVQSKAEKCRGL